MKTIIIDGMHCQSCVKAVRESLEKLNPASLKVELGKVEIESSSSNEELRDAIEGIGFDVKEIQE